MDFHWNRCLAAVYHESGPETNTITSPIDLYSVIEIIYSTIKRLSPY